MVAVAHLAAPLRNQVYTETNLNRLQNIEGIQEKYDALEKELKQIKNNIIQNESTKAKVEPNARNLINVNGAQLNHLRFADDLILISGDAIGLQEMLEQLVFESENIGLSMNTSKTKLMTNVEQIPIVVNGSNVEYVE
ncbi:uncharacterized protein LOC135194102 [Vanessa tameamea]|uniref:Uncharacterized protein LOC135194102 n=1 Tax=Vanessa tameamea TaxID=334116 RepID=A0ABM4AU22_VANTA